MNEFVPINLDERGEVLPEKNSLTALIDADTIAFSASSATEVCMDVLPQTFYTVQEWEDLIRDPDYDETLGVIYQGDLDQALRHANDKIKVILDRTGCEKYVLYFSGGRDNFRYTVEPGYKGNRINMHIPAQLRELKELLLEKHPGVMCTEWEADDEVVCRYYEAPEEHLVCAVDKDVLGSVPHAFNYYFKAATTKKGKDYKEIPMKFIDNDAMSIMRHPFKQTLMGDANDGIGGIFRCGKVGAEKILNRGEQTEEGLWEVVLEAYDTAGMSEFDAIQTMQLVNMRQLVRDSGNNWILKLWLPKFENNQISS